MRDELEELVSLKKNEIQESEFKNEDETKQGLILPIINGLGWNVFNTKEVTPEYGVKGKKVDYCLVLDGKPKVFIEVKKTAESLEKHQDQLLGYSYSQGITLSVLTNGIDWWFYLPMIPKPWDERIFCEMNLTKGKTNDLVENFIRFLSKERVKNGESIKLAQEIYDDKLKSKTIEETIPRIWNGIMSELLESQEKSLLYDLISDEIQRICNLKPQPQSIVDFVRTNWNRFYVDEDEPIIIQDKPKVKPEKPTSIQFVSSEKEYYGKKVRKFRFDGKVKEVKLWKDVLVGLCEMIYEKHKGEFKKVFEIKGRTRLYFVKDESKVRGPRPISTSGVFVETHFSSNDMMRRCREILDKFGYSIDHLELGFQESMAEGGEKIKVVKPKKNEDTSLSVIMKMEKKLNFKLEKMEVKRGRGKYFQSDDEDKTFVILTSRLYKSPTNDGFWFGLRQNQIKFLSENTNSHLVLVCGDSSSIFVKEWNEFKDYTKKMNVSGKDDKQYFHIKIFRKEKTYILGLPELGSGVDISKSII
jgi:predicted type IV restriction endonuclease